MDMVGSVFHSQPVWSRGTATRSYLTGRKPRSFPNLPFSLWALQPAAGVPTMRTQLKARGQGSPFMSSTELSPQGRMTKAGKGGGTNRIDLYIQNIHIQDENICCQVNHSHSAQKLVFHGNFRNSLA